MVFEILGCSRLVFLTNSEFMLQFNWCLLSLQEWKKKKNSQILLTTKFSILYSN